MQLASHINSNKLDNPHQSAYKLCHFTETALVLIKNEVQLSLARGEPTALVLLDLVGPFDTIDHKLLSLAISNPGLVLVEISPT